MWPGPAPLATLQQHRQAQLAQVASQAHAAVSVRTCRPCSSSSSSSLGCSRSVSCRAYKTHQTHCCRQTSCRSSSRRQIAGASSRMLMCTMLTHTVLQRANWMLACEMQTKLQQARGQGSSRQPSSRSTCALSSSQRTRLCYCRTATRQWTATGRLELHSTCDLSAAACDGPLWVCVGCLLHPVAKLLVWKLLGQAGSAWLPAAAGLLQFVSH